MPKPAIDLKTARRLAGYELNGLLFAGVLPMEVYQGGRISVRGTPIYDLNGEVLFYRYAINKKGSGIGYADVAASPAFSQPLLAAASGAPWNEHELHEQAEKAARKHHKAVEKLRTRFVAYSYPKLAVQFLEGRKEVLMLELGTWLPVPASRERHKEEPPGNFERWSLLDETTVQRKEQNVDSLRKRLANWDETIPRLEDRKFRDLSLLNTVDFEKLVKAKLRLRSISRELHYSPLQTDHHVCYEVRGQLTNVWCVAASTQMILDFYRYNYSQERVASELGLGTLASPSGLPYANDHYVVDVLQKLTSNCLTAHMDTSPNWAEFVSEINANRPLVSFIPGHSRTVAGYTETFLFVWHTYQGLLVFDPWPPTSGVITRWENFNTQTYRRTFTAHLTLV